MTFALLLLSVLKLLIFCTVALAANVVHTLLGCIHIVERSTMDCDDRGEEDMP